MTHQQPDAATLVAMCDIILTAARQLAAIPAPPHAEQAPAADGRGIPLATPCSVCTHPFNWHKAGVCQVNGCACIAFAVGQRPEPMDPVRILGAEIPAADEDRQRTTRAARREQLHVLLARADRGSINPVEAALLRQHVEAEISEAAVLRGDVKWLGPSRRTWKANAEEMERERDSLADDLKREQAASAGLAEQIRKQREVLDRVGHERDRARARVRQLETAARAALHLCGDQSGDVQVLLRAALDGTEQPATDLRAVLAEANQVMDMQREFIGILRRIVMTAAGHREDEGVQHESCEGCSRDHMNELYDAIVAADKRYASAFPASADGPARPGRLPAQPTPKDAP